MDTNNNIWRLGKHPTRGSSVVPAYPFRDMCNPSLEPNVRNMTYLMIVGVDAVSIFKCNFDDHATINLALIYKSSPVMHVETEDIHSPVGHLPAALWEKRAQIKYWSGHFGLASLGLRVMFAILILLHRFITFVSKVAATEVLTEIM